MALSASLYGGTAFLGTAMGIQVALTPLCSSVTLLTNSHGKHELLLQCGACATAGMVQ